jgi:hypothetical protein
MTGTLVRLGFLGALVVTGALAPADASAFSARTGIGYGDFRFQGVQPMPNLKQGTWANFGPFTVAAGDSIDASLSNGDSFDNVDLYVRNGAQPTSSRWDCRPALAGNERCTFTQAGSYYVSVFARSCGGSVAGFTDCDYALGVTRTINVTLVQANAVGSVTTFTGPSVSKAFSAGDQLQIGIPVPAGNYLLSYNFLSNGSYINDRVFCSFSPGGAPRFSPGVDSAILLTSPGTYNATCSTTYDGNTAPHLLQATLVRF